MGVSLKVPFLSPGNIYVNKIGSRAPQPQTVLVITAAPAKTLILASEGTRAQDTQPTQTPALQKLLENKCLLFSAFNNELR
jgi:hypothetical protein